MVRRQNVLLAVYGEGGHRAEMTALIERLQTESNQLQLITFGVGELPFEVVEHIPAADIRSKHSRLINLFMTLPLMLAQLWTMVNILRRYQLAGMISTGPGLAVIPTVLCRLLRIKTLFIETYCRFNSRSITGRLMYRLSHRFLVQNKSLQPLYPNSEYCGRL